MQKLRLLCLAVAAVVLSHELCGQQVRLQLSLGQSVLPAAKTCTAYLKIRLRGFAFLQESERPPVNLAIVIDRSGSMAGEKIRKAKEAAASAIGRLTSRDIASVIAYNHTVQVLVPATRLTDRQSVLNAVARLEATGQTALFAGVSKGAAEIRKFKDPSYVNRIILISDGLANVGPSSPAELGELACSLAKEGISVSTVGLGLGYNEDLMARLALASDGMHYFAESPADLVRIFNRELGDVLAVAAQDVYVTITCRHGIRPVRVLGRQATFDGRQVIVRLNQLYSEQETFILLECEIPPQQAGATMAGALAVEVSYFNMKLKRTQSLRGSISLKFSDSEEIVQKSVDPSVMAAVVEQIAVDNSERAMRYRDRGMIEEARKLLNENKAYVLSNAIRFKSKRLKKLAEEQQEALQQLDSPTWLKHRKRLVEQQSMRRAQRR